MMRRLFVAHLAKTASLDCGVRRNPAHFLCLRILRKAFEQALSVVWLLPMPVPGCTHPYKYRLAYVIEDVCVVRFDNERGKGDHWHYGADEQPFAFHSPEQLLLDFEQAIARWNDEHGID